MRILMKNNRKAAGTENTKPFVAEVYKMLQMRLNYAMNAGNMKVITFTSIVPCEGKSVHVFNTAISMVLEGKKVLVIDCNIDNTKLLHNFGIEKNPGREEERVHNGSSETVREIPEMPGLYFMSSSIGLQGSGGILDMEKVSVLIETIRGEYDVIFIDSPPAGIVAEGVKLSVIADGTVLVVPSGKTTKTSAKRVKEILDSINVTVLGVILEQ